VYETVREKKENTEDQSHFSAHSPLLSLVSVPSQFLFSFLSILSNLAKLSLTPTLCFFFYLR
jgi:hypothetical protein